MPLERSAPTLKEHHGAADQFALMEEHRADIGADIDLASSQPAMPYAPPPPLWYFDQGVPSQGHGREYQTSMFGSPASSIYNPCGLIRVTPVEEANGAVMTGQAVSDKLPPSSSRKNQADRHSPTTSCPRWG